MTFSDQSARRTLRAGFAIPVLFMVLPCAAFAQSQAAPDASVFDGDYLMVGAGAIHGPSYEGSDDQVTSVVPVIQGKLAGIEITPRPGGIALDLISDAQRPKIGFSFGPVGTFSRNRNSQIKDPVVRSAGKLKAALDLGVNGGVTFYRLLNPYDSVTVSADMRWNVNGAHRGRIASPGISYVTPLSRAVLVTLGVSAKHVDDDYARYYYTVSAQHAADSGLPQFSAKGGWASVNANMLAGYDLNANVLDGGFALFVLGTYGKLLNDAKRNPWTAIRGDDDQWLLGAGLGYTF